MKGSRTVTILLVIALINATLGAKLIPRGMERYKEVDLAEDEALPMVRTLPHLIMFASFMSKDHNKDIGMGTRGGTRGGTCPQDVATNEKVLFLFLEELILNDWVGQNVL